jgi:hypothetical protein
MIDVQMLEVEWYKKNGKYQDRIVKDALGKEFVIGDWSWERNFPDRPEYADILMKKYCEIKAKHPGI